MLISVRELTKNFNISPESILHIGAHTAEEKIHYEEYNWGSQGIIWVEAQAELCDLLKEQCGENEKILNCLAWNENDKKFKFKITNNSQSSSVLDFGTHSKTYPDIQFIDEVVLKAVRLDSLLSWEDDNFEFINVDVQGVEKQALEGLGEFITKANYIYSEVNKIYVYQDCTLVQNLDIFLKQFGFKRVLTKWVEGAGWGDALYMRYPKYKYMIIGLWLQSKYKVIGLVKFKIIRLGLRLKSIVIYLQNNINEKLNKNT